jgi:hypothetical protein
LIIALFNTVEVIEEGEQVIERISTLNLLIGGEYLALFKFFFLLLNIISFGFDNWSIV